MAGGVYHVTTLGWERRDMVRDDEDRAREEKTNCTEQPLSSLSVSAWREPMRLYEASASMAVMWLMWPFRHNSQLRRFARFVAPLYGALKWAAVAVFGALLVALVDGFVKTGPAVVEPGNAPILGQFLPYLLAPSVYCLLLLWASFIGNSERRLRSAVATYALAEDLKLEDLGFREASAQETEPTDIFHQHRPYFKKYFPRKVVDDVESNEEGPKIIFTEEELDKLLRDGGGFLLVGPHWAGKTMTVFQVVRRMTGYVVIRPHPKVVPHPDTFAILRGQNVVMVVDNLHNFVGSDCDLVMFRNMVTEATQRPCGVAATCRDGGESAPITLGQAKQVGDFYESLRKLRLRLMGERQRVELAATSGMQLESKEARNYALPGHITMRHQIREMARAFGSLDERSKNALRAMKLIDQAGIPLNISRFQTVIRRVFHHRLEDERIEDILKNLRHHDFLLKNPDTTRLADSIDFGVLDAVVSYTEGRKPSDERWDALAEALEMERDVKGLLYLSHNQGRTGNLERALKAVECALRIDPEDPQAHYQRGYSLARLGELEKALEANDQALKIRSEFAEAWNNRAYILSQHQDYQSALEAANRALELRPNYDDAHTNKAIVLARLGRLDESVVEHNASLGIRKDNAYSHLNLGITLSRQNYFDKAIEAYEEALRLRPEYPQAYLNLGITLARKAFNSSHEDRTTLRW